MTAERFAQACIALIHDLADASGTIALQHFRTNVAIDDKSDASPVTIADRDAEAAMRERIAKAFPDHGIVGEEHGRHQSEAEWLWILDPIDGTASFITGVPLFGTLIGLWQRSPDGAGKPYLGCINHPALGERWVGGAGQETRRNGAPVRARACADVAAAALFATGPGGLDGRQAAAFARLESRVKRRRFGGTDCYHYAMVASGWIDLACEATLKLHDYAALVPVLENAGATITDWNGRRLTLESETSVRGEVLAAGDARVHAAAVNILQEHA
jgi:inositol-phosphate phosphatase/L-galactose 1-phosphate phosphatase/histidinol-phosphatase